MIEENTQHIIQNDIKFKQLFKDIYNRRIMILYNEDDPELKLKNSGHMF